MIGATIAPLCRLTTTPVGPGLRVGMDLGHFRRVDGLVASWTVSGAFPTQRVAVAIGVDVVRIDDGATGGATGFGGLGIGRVKVRHGAGS